MIDPVLSICIPTLNRAPFLKGCLAAITREPGCEKVEIIIVDGGSNDSSLSVADSARLDGLNIKYIQSCKDSGLDKDMELAVKHSVGALCWLLADDDVIVEGALKQILRRVESLSDVYISDVVFCNKNLKPHSRSRFLNANDGQVFDISKTQEYIEYIRSSSSNNALFCYMSNIIFKRSSWRFSNQGLYVYGYNHVFELLNTKNEVSCYTIEYVKTPIVKNRADNDSFVGGGIYKRYMIDFRGYSALADLVNKNDLVAREAFLSNMQKEHGFFRLLKLRVNVTGAEWLTIVECLRVFCYPDIMITVLSLIPRQAKPAVQVMEFLNRTVKRIQGCILVLLGPVSQVENK
jgi:abequosyltransferase